MSNQSIVLFRHLLRQVRKLPKESRPYYSHYVRQHFDNHTLEDDEEYVDHMIAKARKDAEWVVKKYTPSEGK